MSIAKSTLFGGHIVDLIDIKTVSSTSIKLFWEVNIVNRVTHFIQTVDYRSWTL